MEVAEAARASVSSTLKDAVGPESTVIGDATRPRRSTEELSRTLTPWGMLASELKNGSSPCPSTYGSHTRSQRNST